MTKRLWLLKNLNESHAFIIPRFKNHLILVQTSPVDNFWENIDNTLMNPSPLRMQIILCSAKPTKKSCIGYRSPGALQQLTIPAIDFYARIRM